MDRISNLPVDLIRRIISSVPLKDAAKTSVLSKRWRTIWDSRPDIHLDEFLFWYRRDAFHSYLQKFLDTREKYCEYNSCAVDKLFLHMTVMDDNDEDLVNQLIEFAVDNKVKTLHLFLQGSFGRHFNVIAAATLVELIFQECHIKYCSFVLPSLKTLYLQGVDIDNELFADLIAGCPQIESLRIDNCQSLSHIVISNPTLKFFRMVDKQYYGELQIKSTNLEFLELAYLCQGVSEVAISSTTTVKNLILRHMSYNNILLSQFIRQFPLLEKLVIHHRGVSEIEAVTTDAPKLKSLQYVGGLTNFPGIKASKELEFVKLQLEPKDEKEDYEYDSIWYIWLRDSLESFAHSKHLTLKCWTEEAIMFPDKLVQKLPFNDIKHLELKIKKCSATIQEILDGFIWILPGLKTLKLTLGSKSKFIEFPQRSRE